MAVAFGPSGTDFEQPLVGCRSRLVPSGIAEHPGTEIGYLFLLRPQLEGDAGAFGGVLAPSPVHQGFAEPAKENGEFGFGNFAPSKVDSAGLDEIAGAAQWSGAVYRLFANYIEIGHSTMFSGRCAVTVNIKNSLVRMKRHPS